MKHGSNTRFAESKCYADYHAHLCCFTSAQDFCSGSMDPPPSTDEELIWKATSISHLNCWKLSKISQHRALCLTQPMPVSRKMRSLLISEAAARSYVTQTLVIQAKTQSKSQINMQQTSAETFVNTQKTIPSVCLVR